MARCYILSTGVPAASRSADGAMLWMSRLLRK